jgi:hypothetical protein
MTGQSGMSARSKMARMDRDQESKRSDATAFVLSWRLNSVCLPSWELTGVSAGVWSLLDLTSRSGFLEGQLRD